MSVDDSSRFSIVPDAAPLAYTADLPPEQAARLARARTAKQRAVTSLHAQIERLRTYLAATRPAPRVLVVDDHPEMATLIADAIREETGVDVTVVTHAGEALTIARDAGHGDFVAAVIDLHLNHPTVNGVTVAAALKRGVAVFLVTGAMPSELAEAARRVSAVGAFEKPLTSDMLHAMCVAIGERLAATAPLAVH